MLVGEDVLPDKERFLLEIARITKVGFLQQNAFHKIDTFVPLEKQFEMLNTIDILYREGMSVLDLGVSISEVKNSSLISEIINMKYDITNEDYTSFTILNNKIREFYRGLRMQYSATDEIEE